MIMDEDNEAEFNTNLQLPVTQFNEAEIEAELAELERQIAAEEAEADKAKASSNINTNNYQQQQQQTRQSSATATSSLFGVPPPQAKQAKLEQHSSSQQQEQQVKQEPSASRIVSTSTNMNEQYMITTGNDGNVKLWSLNSTSKQDKSNNLVDKCYTPTLVQVYKNQQLLNDNSSSFLSRLFKHKQQQDYASYQSNNQSHASGWIASSVLVPNIQPYVSSSSNSGINSKVSSVMVTGSTSGTIHWWNIDSGNISNTSNSSSSTCSPLLMSIDINKLENSNNSGNSYPSYSPFSNNRHESIWSLATATFYVTPENSNNNPSNTTKKKKSTVLVLLVGTSIGSLFIIDFITGLVLNKVVIPTSSSNGSTNIIRYIKVIKNTVSGNDSEVIVLTGDDNGVLNVWKLQATILTSSSSSSIASPSYSSSSVPVYSPSFSSSSSSNSGYSPFSSNSSTSSSSSSIVNVQQASEKSNINITITLLSSSPVNNSNNNGSIMVILQPFVVTNINNKKSSNSKRQSMLDRVVITAGTPPQQSVAVWYINNSSKLVRLNNSSNLSHYYNHHKYVISYATMIPYYTEHDIDENSAVKYFATTSHDSTINIWNIVATVNDKDGDSAISVDYSVQFTIENPFYRPVRYVATVPQKGATNSTILIAGDDYGNMFSFQVPHSSLKQPSILWSNESNSHGTKDSYKYSGSAVGTITMFKPTMLWAREHVEELLRQDGEESNVIKLRNKCTLFKIPSSSSGSNSGTSRLFTIGTMVTVETVNNNYYL